MKFYSSNNRTRCSLSKQRWKNCHRKTDKIYLTNDER